MQKAKPLFFVAFVIGLNIVGANLVPNAERNVASVATPSTPETPKAVHEAPDYFRGYPVRY